MARRGGEPGRYRPGSHEGEAAGQGHGRSKARHVSLGRDGCNASPRPHGNDSWLLRLEGQVLLIFVVRPAILSLIMPSLTCGMRSCPFPGPSVEISPTRSLRVSIEVIIPHALQVGNLFRHGFSTGWPSHEHVCDRRIHRKRELGASSSMNCTWARG